MYKGDSAKIFGELLCIKETKYTLCLPVQSSKYKGNSGEFFPKFYGWILKIKDLRFDLFTSFPSQFCKGNSAEFLTGTDSFLFMAV